MLSRILHFVNMFLYFVTRMSRNTLSESLEDEIMLLHLFEMQDRNNSTISESSPWTASPYNKASKKIKSMTNVHRILRVKIFNKILFKNENIKMLSSMMHA